jgi:hypothetical protein
MRLAFLALAALLVAGCSAGDDRRGSVDPDVGPEGAAVRVVVVDDANRRVAGATVLLQESGRFGTTDANGIHVERAVRAGVQETVVVNAEGHHDGRESFAILAGQVTEVVVRIDRMR